MALSFRGEAAAESGRDAPSMTVHPASRKGRGRLRGLFRFAERHAHFVDIAVVAEFYHAAGRGRAVHLHPPHTALETVGVFDPDAVSRRAMSVGHFKPRPVA